ncbi:hypothetical protein AX774_g1097 [Zancudomyces culisetae]|uniref:Uncharacterized protein n=1 Tax=Zancudomyces culisetae TaxID=1213189 RepID=A0A1R1PWR5_ZANCU|nr:hypothetical protein AX774_g3759 [Zancudomyces culisetae]OMH85342.1 hypothetical protein AX774_g1097 [Zancudomyces culisetae]|eukprot:OMH82758.1 hypothetical protein AX774_g3759 [Zancudomyces culisetae]
MSFSERIFFGATGLGGGYVNRNHRNDKSGWKGKGSERERVQDESSEVLYEICKKSKELVVQSSMKVCEKQEELVNEIRKVEKQMEESRKRAEKINKQVRMEMELSYRLKSIGRVAEESYEAMNGIFESMERLERMLPKRLQLMEGDTEGQKRYGRLVESMTARRYKGVGSKEKEEMRKHKTMGEYVKKIEKKVDEDENELEENIEFDRREESERKGERAYEEKAEVDGKTLGLAAHTQFKWGLIGRAASPLGDYRDYKGKTQEEEKGGIKGFAPSSDVGA